MAGSDSGHNHKPISSIKHYSGQAKCPCPVASSLAVVSARKKADPSNHTARPVEQILFARSPMGFLFALFIRSGLVQVADEREEDGLALETPPLRRAADASSPARFQSSHASVGRGQRSPTDLRGL